MIRVIEVPSEIPEGFSPIILVFARSNGGNTESIFHIDGSLLEGLKLLPPQKRIADIEQIVTTLKKSLLQYTSSN